MLQNYTIGPLTLAYGTSISMVGDLNGDGRSDLAIGSSNGPGLTPNSVSVFYGQTNGGDVADANTATPGADGFVITGEAVGDGLGSALASAGDFNGDGREDLLISAPGASSSAGAVYVVYGRTGGDVSDITLGANTGQYMKITGEAAGDLAGWSIAGIGDINGDGLDDIAIGAPSQGSNDNGAAYVIYGSRATDVADISLASLGSNGFRMTGSGSADAIGYKVASAGDFDGDGIKDLLVSATGDNLAFVDAGAVYVIYGRSLGGDMPDLDLNSLGNQGFRIIGEASSDALGSSVSSAGDVNGDGFDDLLVGAITNDKNAGNSGNNVGAAYIIYGTGHRMTGNYQVNSDAVILSITVDSTVPSVQIKIPAGSILNKGTYNSGTDTWNVLATDLPNVMVKGASVGSTFTMTIQDQVGTHTISYTLSSATDRVDIDMTSLGTQGFRIIGEGTGDWAGYAVAGIGDVNGDGLDDMIVGAPFNDTNAANAGAAYVIYGRNNVGDLLADINLSSLGVNGFKISGNTAGQGLGEGVSGGGDINGDGYDDFIVNGRSLSSSVYVVYGSSGGGDLADLDLSSMGTRGFVISGEGSTPGMVSATFVGDVNGDGLSDMLIGAPGTGANAAYIVYGVSNGGDLADLNLASLGAQGFKISAEAVGDQLGYSVSSAGDFNGDGRADFILGATRNAAGGTAAGAAYVIYGSAAGGDLADLNLASLGAQGVKITGDNAGDLAGHSVASAGDVNGDGLDDLIILSRWSDSNGMNSGTAYVIYGRTATADVADIDLSNLGANSFQINGPAATWAMNSVASAGDVNGDGLDDVIVTSENYNTDGTHRGVAYVIYGRSSGGVDLADINLNNLGTNGFVISGAAEDGLGTFVSAAGDVNGDGLDDLMVGASQSTNTTGTGVTYVIYGSNNLPQQIIMGDANANHMISGAMNESLNGGAGNDEYRFDANTHLGKDLVLDSAGIDTLSFTATSTAISVNLGTSMSQRVNGYLDLTLGSSAIENVIGGSGNDSIIGSASANTLTGGAGDDVLTGGADSDTFDYNALTDRGTGAEVITDFAVGAGGDKLDLRDLLATFSGYNGSNAFSAGYVNFQASGSNTVVQVDADGSAGAGAAVTLVTLNNVTLLATDTNNLITPVMLDLNGDNQIAYRSLADSNVSFDVNGDGQLDKLAWVGAQDGVLVYDQNGDGIVNSVDEFAFGRHLNGSATDLEGLGLFDSNGNGKLDAGDADFAKFAVWQDSNGNGISDTGEVKTLSQYDISAISLSSNQQISQSGDVMIYGEGHFVYSNGSTGLLTDAAVSFGDASTLASNTDTSNLVNQLFGSSATSGVPGSLPAGEQTELRAALDVLSGLFETVHHVMAQQLASSGVTMDNSVSGALDHLLAIVDPHHGLF